MRRSSRGECPYGPIKNKMSVTVRTCRHLTSCRAFLCLAMNLFNRIAASLMLFLLVAAGAKECLVSDARMNSAERVCCQQMAGQCDSNMAAKHSCCQKMVRHNEADVKETQHIVPVLLPLHLPLLGTFSLDTMAASAPTHPGLLDRPPDDVPSSSITILRI
jgi:hypothetical protein